MSAIRGPYFSRVRRLPDGTIEAIRSDRKAGKTLRQLSLKYNLSDSTIYKLTAGIESPNVERRRQARVAARAGATITSIAKVLRVSRSTVRDWCKDLQISRKNGRPVKAVQDQRNLEAFASAMGGQE